MTKLRKLSIIVIALTLISVAIVMAATKKVGDKAPDFKLPAIDGKTVTLNQIRSNPANAGTNRVVLIQFWATWCPYCVQETPYLQQLQNKYGKQGFAVVGISIDREGASVVKPFVKDHKLTYTVLTDPNQTAYKAYYAGQGIPLTFLVDKKGVIRYTAIGFSPDMAKEMDRQIAKLLK